MFSDLEFFGKVAASDRAEVLAGCDFISGHFGRLGPLVPPEFLRICVLRDPLRRVVSGYNHIMGDLKDPLHEAARNLSLCEAMDSEKFAGEMWNHQSRLIVANAGENFDALSDKQRIECCTAFLSEQTACFGVLEHSDRMLVDLREKIGIPLLTVLPITNIDVTAHGVAKSAIHDCIGPAVHRNRVDIAVYSYALSALGY